MNLFKATRIMIILMIPHSLQPAECSYSAPSFFARQLALRAVTRHGESTVEKEIRQYFADQQLHFLKPPVFVIKETFSRDHEDNFLNSIIFMVIDRIEKKSGCCSNNFLAADTAYYWGRNGTVEVRSYFPERNALLAIIKR